MTETDVKTTDLRIAQRDSKTATRPYVIVNPMLAKHMPVSPGRALRYFACLGEKVAARCRGERVLVIGFAETATAVGAAVAAVIEEAVYVHTTREELNGAVSGDALSCRLVSEFLEEHSHAKNQALYLREEWFELSQFDRIVFVEDEITTGKTIRNFLRSVPFDGKITVAALVFNGFDEALLAQYKADCVCLQKTGYVHYLEFLGPADPRSGVEGGAYRTGCLRLAAQVAEACAKEDILDRTVLVMGTEECMYPALVLGQELELSAKSVRSQSTTRSPLVPGDEGRYPLRSRREMMSVYERTRTTFLYNLQAYDTVIVMSDAPGACHSELVRVLQDSGNGTLYFVRIHNAY